MGVLGCVAAYFGLLESQGHGMLHLHLLMWLANTLMTDEIHNLLKTADFREHVIKYIRSNLHTYLLELNSAETV